MKQLSVDHDVTVVERNRPYDTFGWGVVFSDATMDNMRAWDAPTADTIQQAFNHWDDIELHFKGRAIRSGGHGFVGIGRKKLLNILQARCEELGVKLVFETEVNADTDYPDADLIIASDGINSRIRGRYADVFKPDIVTRPNRFIWLGTNKQYDAFTFLFEKTEHGWFQAHIYKFDDTTSTFIVECPEHVWKAHGLDRADQDQSIAFCEELFAAQPARREADDQRASPARFGVAQFPAHHVRAVVALQRSQPRGADGRCGAHRALRDRLGHQARARRRDRADVAVQAARRHRRSHSRGARALPGGARGRRGAPAERGVERDGVVRGVRRALLRPARARAVHVLDADAQPAHQPREPAPARQGLARRLRTLVRRQSGRAHRAGRAADVHALHRALCHAEEPGGRLADGAVLLRRRRARRVPSRAPGLARARRRRHGGGRDDLSLPRRAHHAGLSGPVERGPGPRLEAHRRLRAPRVRRQDRDADRPRRRQGFDQRAVARRRRRSAAGQWQLAADRRLAACPTSTTAAPHRRRWTAPTWIA